MEPVIVILFIAAMFVGISIGASSVAPGFAPLAAASKYNILKLAFVAGFFGLLGAILQGQNVADKIGSELLVGEFEIIQPLVVFFVAGTLVFVSLLTDIPMPTAFTVVGAVIGSSYAVDAGINWGSLNTILLYWLLVPFLSVFIGFVAAKLMQRFLDKEESKREIIWLLFIFGAYGAYTSAASHVGLAIGPLQGLGYSSLFLLFFGGFSILIGAWMYSPRVIQAVSSDYSNLGPRKAIAALASSSILAQIGVFLGVPVSFNQAILASVIGSGLVEGSSNIGKTKILHTVGAWVFAFILSILAAYIGVLIIS